MVQLVPYSTRRWTPSLAVEYFLYRYHEEPAHDFDGQVLSFGSQLDLSSDRSWVWDASYSLWRFVNVHGPSDAFYKEGLLENYFTWTRPLSSQPAVYFQASYGLSFRHASPSDFDRLENALVFSLYYLPWNDWELSAFVRPASRLYLTEDGRYRDRRDFHLESGLSIVWERWHNFSARSDISWAWNYSNTPDQDYRAVEPQVSVSAELAF